MLETGLAFSDTGGGFSKIGSGTVSHGRHNLKETYNSTSLSGEIFALIETFGKNRFSAAATELHAYEQRMLDASSSPSATYKPLIYNGFFRFNHSRQSLGFH